MYEEINSIEFSGEMKINELYHLYKTNSSQMNLELFSRIQNFSTSNDFFKHYMNKDIKLFYENMDNFIYQLSSITRQSDIKFDSQIDQYISDFSYIFVLFNIISKINKSLENILLNEKSTLYNLYEKYQLDKNLQEKFNECIDNLLHISTKKKFSHNFSCKSTKDNSNDSLIYNRQSNFIDFNNESKEFSQSDKIPVVVKDLLGYNNLNKEQNNINNINVINKTPRFNNILNINPSYSNNENNNNDLIIEKNSKDSEFTFTSNKNININIENENKYFINNNRNKTEIKDNNYNKESDDINDYITSVQKDAYLIKPIKTRRKSCMIRTFKPKNSLEKNCNKSNDDLNKRNLFFSNKSTNNNFEKIQSYKKLHASTGQLFKKEESKKYADLLEIIIELYKFKKINLEQKLKLKRLIICKSPKILNVYKFFNTDNEKFVIELKKIIQ